MEKIFYLTGKLFLLQILVGTIAFGQTADDDSKMRQNAASRIARNHSVSLDWQEHSLIEITDIEMRLNTVKRIKRNHGKVFNWQESSFLELSDIEARLNAVARIKRNHGVSFVWKENNLLKLIDAESRMNAAKRLSNATGKKVNWRDFTLLQLAEEEAKLSGKSIKAIKSVPNQISGQGTRAVTNRPVYITKIDEDNDDVLILGNGGIVEITQGFLGYVGYRKDAILFKDGMNWKIWIEGKKVYKCDLLKATLARASGNGEMVYISEVKGDGKILLMLDGSIYEVDDLYTIETSLWLGLSEALLIDENRLINLDEGGEVIDVIKLK